MKVLVIGGSGFIGTRLLDLLTTTDGIQVINYDINVSKKYPECTILGDVRDNKALIEATRGVDVIYNLAAEHADNVTPTSLYHQVNVGGAKNIVHAANVNMVKKIVFTSTVAIYGLDRGTPDENVEPQPFNEYGQSKLEAEKIFDTWFNENRDRTLVTIRPAVVFGEDNRGNVYNLINQIVSKRFLMIGDGQNRKSMGYVGNVSDFLKDQLRKSKGHYVYNYADKADLSASEIVSIVKEEMNIPGSNVSVPYNIGLLGGHVFDIFSKLTGKKFPVSTVRIKKFCADTTIDSSAALASGFKPPYSLEEGLRRMIRHDFK